MLWAPWAAPDPPPRVEELQGQCRCRGNARSRLGLWGWGPGWLHAARRSPSPGDAPTAGRVAAQPSGTSLAGPSPPRRLPRLPVGAWARQPPQRSCFWKPEKPRRCPEQRGGAAVSPTPAALPGCQPAACSRPHRLALCRGSNEIPAPALRRREQRRVLCSGGGCQGRAAGLGGQREAGRTTDPPQKQVAREPGSAASALRAEEPGCRSYRSPPESPTAHAVFLAPRRGFVRRVRLDPRPTWSSAAPRSPALCSWFPIPAFAQQPCWHRVPSPGGLAGTICCPGAFSPLSPPPAACWQTARRGKRASAGWLLLREREVSARLPRCCATAGIRTWLFLPTPS